MSINTLYVPLFTIEEVILDKDTGLPLAGGIVKFYRDLQRATPKAVFQISGNPPDYSFTNIGNELTLGLSGTFVDGSGDPFVPYAYPYDADGDIDLYYVTVESSGNVDQFTREAVPHVDSSSSSSRSNSDNELSNSQFVEINFPPNGPVTYTVTGTDTVTQIAPDWDIISSGTGTLTITRLLPTAEGVLTNPPYILSIASTGFGATIKLRQRLLHSPSFMRGGFASGHVLASIISGGSSNLSMTYVSSSGESDNIIGSTAITNDGAYHQIVGNVAIPQFVNDTATDGYVDINVIIPTSRTIGLSSIQVVATSDSVDIPYDEETVSRQKDHLFHYYENSILILPKCTLLTGWNFRQNPCQGFNGGPTTFSTTPTYCFDQTQIWSSAANSISVSRLSDPRNFLSIGAVHAATQGTIAMLQYIDGSTMLGYWGYLMSVLARARIVTSGSTSVKLKCRLFTISGTPSAASTVYPVASWDSNGDPVFAAGITPRSPVNDAAYVLQDNYEGTNLDPVCPAMAFNGISSEIITSSSSNATLGILLYTVGNLDSSIDDSIIFESVSLVPNEFATDDTPKSFDQVLRECQFYYESSYSNGVSPGTSNQEASSIYMTQLANYSAPNISFVARSFGLSYKTVKRDIPSVSFYSAKTGAGITTVASYLRTAGSSFSTEVDIDTGTNWEAPAIGTNSLIMLAKNVTPQNPDAGANTFPEAYIQFHYILDSRLGK